MAKYAISQEGAEQMSSLAYNLLINANNISEASQVLSNSITTLSDGLGIYADEIREIIVRNQNTLNNYREDTIQFAKRIKEKANDILTLVSLGIAGGAIAGGLSAGKTAGGANHNGSAFTHSRPNLALTSNTYNTARNHLENMNVTHLPIAQSGAFRTEEEIVSSLGGGDMTPGSCSSLAFAYAGNKAGYDVLDFRDGLSRDFFSRNGSISMIANLPGVRAEIINGTDDIECADKLLCGMSPDKEYYLATGEHAAIVRLHNGHYEYLELQSPTDNGWHLLHDAALYNRFGCDQNSVELPNFLIDVDSLSESDEFLDILGYINTAESEQNKGDSGYVR